MDLGRRFVVCLLRTDITEDPHLQLHIPSQHRVVYVDVDVWIMVEEADIYNISREGAASSFPTQLLRWNECKLWCDAGVSQGQGG